MICDLFSLGKHINGEQITELEVEEKTQGRKLADVLVKVATIVIKNKLTETTAYQKLVRFIGAAPCVRQIQSKLLPKDSSWKTEYWWNKYPGNSKRRHGYYLIDKSINGKKVGLSSRKHINPSALCTSIV